MISISIMIMTSNKLIMTSNKMIIIIIKIRTITPTS